MKGRRSLSRLIYLHVQCPYIICGKDYLCFILLPLLLYQRSIHYICVGFFLVCILFIGLFFYSFTNTIVLITVILWEVLKSYSISPQTLFFINTVLAILGLLLFHVNFRAKVSISMKQHPEILIEIMLSLQIKLGRIHMLTGLSLLIHENRIFLQ